MNAHSTNKTTWLLKREFWENKGGFLWAPIFAGAIFLLMSVMAIFGAESVRRTQGGGEELVVMNGVHLNQLTKTLKPEELAELGGGLDIGTLMAGAWPFIVLAFVVFFYCLGALYDERKDRSILFWKSLPLSDGQTVLSKVASALVVAPLIANAAAMLTSLGFLLILSAYAMYHGGNPIDLIWGPASPLAIMAGHLSWLPVYLLWALPSVGWLLMCSAWAKTKPFLWAVMLPLFAGIIVSSTHLMNAFDSTSGWFWKHIVGRLLLGTLPGSDVFYRTDQLRAVIGDRDNLVAALAPSNQLAALSLPDIWIGAAVGVVFIIVAIRLRRRAGEI